MHMGGMERRNVEHTCSF